MKLCRLKPRLGIPGEARNAKSGFLSTKFQAFPGNAKNIVGSAGSTLFFAFPGKASTSAGLVRGFGPSFGSDLIFKSG